MKFEDVENTRIQYKNKLVRCSLILLAIFAAIITVLIVITISNGGLSSERMILPLIFMPMFVSLVASIVIVTLVTKKDAVAYKKAYKTYFVEQNLARIFTDLKYKHDAGLSRETLKNTQMINTGDRYSSNDLTMGRYKDVGFTQADVHIEEEHTDSDGDTTYVTIFRGRFMIFEFPKKFNFRLEVISRFFGAARVPGKDSQTGRKFEKFEVESVDFNKKFKIYAEDGFEAFYLLDPAFISRIEKLGAMYDKKMILCFIENRLYVGINEGKDAFEPPRPFKQIDAEVELAKIQSDIKVITNFIDELKLDKKIFV